MDEPKPNPMQFTGRVIVLFTGGVEINGGSRYPFCVVPGIRLEGMWQTHTRAWTQKDWDSPWNKDTRN